MDNVETLMAELRQAGEEPDQALLDRVKALGPAAVDPLIHMALDESLHYAEQESPEVWAPLHAIRLLGELQAPEAIGPLMELLSWDDDYLPELLPEAFGQIGRPAVVPLRALLFDRAQGVTTRSGAGTALSRIAKYHPDVRAEAVEALVARLDPAESQTPDDETLNGSIISDLLDIPAEEAVPAIQKAFDEDRVDQRMVTPEDVSDAFDPSAAPLPMRMDTPAELRLWLRCTTCGYSRPHRVPKVYYDLGAVDRRAREEETPYSDFIIPQRITCPRCGAVDQYELTGEAHLALTGELLRSMDGSGWTRESDSPLVPMRFTVADGREMHPLAALDMYRRQVAAEPDRAYLRVRYGNVLRFLGYITEATDQYQAAVRLDPLQVEAYWNLGLFARDAGNRQEARSMFEHVLALAPQSRLTREEREEYLSEAREEIDNLESPRPRPSRPAGSLASPLPARRQGASAQLEPARLPRQTHKVGRNEPCPCGSGKKYKKCCGR